ncbi:hypothetical protein [Hymenobacter sp. BT730]|uniref:hypothetical protein n=1 Tax=Hymenobacter sp. BT730 TaxID=3063332 RepID=UPI0026E07130|nr:hypothetical protein [Hymenobacter sp. BT730]
MNDNTTLAQEMVAAAPAATRNVTLSTDPKRMAIIKVWGAIRVAPFILGQTNIRQRVPFLINRENVI